jgi:threonylcarbamoyladenosine tRNA methylthiotransferase CDKAL1
MKIYLETYGCTFNQADSEIIAALLMDNGAKIVDSLEEADLIVMNTCYVKQPTEQKIINHIHKIQEKFPKKKLLIAGCMVDIDPRKLEKLAPKAGWIGARRIKSAPEVVDALMNGKILRETGHDMNLKTCLPKSRSNPHVHIIQIAEGCQGKCSYCCTRFARGSLQSYPLQLLKREAEIAVSEGCVELQLTAQDTVAYGKDTGETLKGLIDQINAIEGSFKVRIGMMNPNSILNNDFDVESLINSFKHEKIYNFLHLPIQSGNNHVLEDMGRKYTVEDYLNLINHFRKEIPSLSLATDIIVGYPTEDEAAFQDTLDVISNIKPDFLHISKYHHRPGTQASNFDEIDFSIMKKRSKQLNNLKTEISYQKNYKLIDTIQNILITNKGTKGGYIGRTGSYKTVVVGDAPMGTFITVKIIEARNTYLKGAII